MKTLDIHQPPLEEELDEDIAGADDADERAFESLFEDALAAVPESEDASSQRDNPFLRVALGRKLLDYEQERELGRRLGDARQAMTEGLASFAACVEYLVLAWEQALSGERSPGDVLQWPSGGGAGEGPEDGTGGGNARSRMAQLSIRLGCWRAEPGGQDALETPMDLRTLFVAAAPAFPMLCDLKKVARQALANPQRGRRRAAAAVTRRLEAVDAAELKFQEARRIMLECNLRLVFSIAGKFVNNGVPYDDLVQEGVIGLMRAIEKFEPALGFKFSTYASTWIWQAVTRAIANQRRTVRVPAHVHDKMIRVRGVAACMENQSGRTPSLSELAEATGLSPEVVTRALNAANRSVSLDAPVKDGEGASFLELTADSGRPDAVQQIHDEQIGAMVRGLLAELPAREATILHLRLGISGTDPHTLEEVGAILGITRERTRQLQNRALDTLRSRLKDSGVALM